MRRVCFAFLLGLAFTAHAQDAAHSAEFGVRYWYSEGKSTRSHNAQGFAPSLGNPTSVLTYTNVDAHALELVARKNFNAGWFIKGNAGLGTITRGSFDDEDFFAGQLKFSDTTSSVQGNKLTYASVDLGRDLWRFHNGSAGLFIGYQFWRERLDAYGVVFTLTNPPTTLEGDSVPAISNETTWQALRLGFTSTGYLSPATRLTVEAVLVPYAKVRDEDSHWLRTDPSSGAFFLGPAPNIFMEGTGYGAQFELELRHQMSQSWEVGAGLRWWWLTARDGTREAVGTSVPLKELESQRGGLTLTLMRRW